MEILYIKHIIDDSLINHITQQQQTHEQLTSIATVSQHINNSSTHTFLQQFNNTHQQQQLLTVRQ